MSTRHYRCIRLCHTHPRLAGTSSRRRPNYSVYRSRRQRLRFASSARGDSHLADRLRTGKRSAKWLSPWAADAKRRRLERRWRRTHAESDRVAYSVTCREANREINRSREAFSQNDLRQLAPTRKKLVRELLHTDD